MIRVIALAVLLMAPSVGIAQDDIVLRDGNGLTAALQNGSARACARAAAMIDPATRPVRSETQPGPAKDQVSDRFVTLTTLHADSGGVAHRVICRFIWSRLGGGNTAWPVPILEMISIDGRPVTGFAHVDLMNRLYRELEAQGLQTNPVNW